MAGPFPYPEAPYPESMPQQPFPPPGQPPFYPQPVPSHYPGMLPPPVNYPGHPRRRRLGILTLVVVVVAALAAVAATVVFANRRDDSGTGALTNGAAKTAIQNYLDALASGDQETIARNASCGLFDELKDRRSDMALASLASDAFQRQFKSVDVTSIDKIVVGSPYQAQVLFTMKAVPATRQSGIIERQGVAQILTQGRDILVCSYLPRVGQY